MSHFIKLKLTDKQGKLVSENFYWRGNKRTDFTAINNLPKVNLKVTYLPTHKEGKYFIDARIVNPSSSNTAAFARQGAGGKFKNRGTDFTGNYER